MTDVATTRFDQSLLTHRPKKPGYPLDKVLAKSQSYANQIVVPSGMYRLGDFRDRQPRWRAQNSRY